MLRCVHLTQEQKGKAVKQLNELTASHKADGHKTVTFPCKKSVSRQPVEFIGGADRDLPEAPQPLYITYRF